MPTLQEPGRLAQPENLSTINNATFLHAEAYEQKSPNGRPEKGIFLPNLGGRIEVESEVNQGTAFTVFLPLAANPIPETCPPDARRTCRAK
jgi:hypothetical protein